MAPAVKSFTSDAASISAEETDGARVTAPTSLSTRSLLTAVDPALAAHCALQDSWNFPKSIETIV